MEVVIYGKINCPNCEKAKNLAKKISNKDPDFDYTYIDVMRMPGGADELRRLVGKEIRSVPQIFVDELHIGGFSEFEQAMK